MEKKMKAGKAETLYNKEIYTGRDARVKLPGKAAFYCKAIENAGSVPFHLIFGQEPGDGFYNWKGALIEPMLGILPENFTEKAFEDMIEEIVPLCGDVRYELSEVHSKLRSGEIKNFTAEILVRTVNDEKKWISYSALPVTDEETGITTGIFGILKDITENRLMRKNMAEIRQKEEEVERLKASFLQNISHEIRTPLNAIVGFSALIGECHDGIFPGKWDEFREIIISNSDHLLEVIDNILEISKIEAGKASVKKEKANLNWILLKVYAQFRIDATEKGIQLGYVPGLPDRNSDINTDRFRLTQVITNLVDNAVKFTDSGRVDFGYEVKETKIEFFVSDTGIGIPPEYQEGVFRMFYQAENGFKRNYGGIGLGLAISKAYVEMLGGEMWLTSKPGEGSVFRFTIPYESGDEGA